MWQRGREELERLGIDADAAIDIYLERNRTPFSFGVFDDGVPIAFMGAAEKGAAKYATWFQATEAFPSAGVAATKAIKKFLKQAMRRHPDVDLYLFSASDHPDADRWFRLLGFRYVSMRGNVRVFEYGDDHV